MKNQLAILIGIVVGLLLLTQMFLFQVNYDEVAVLTTFDRAAEPQRDPETGELARDPQTGEPVDPGSLILEPGLYFKAPWPIQKVYDYSKKIHILDDQSVELTTADQKSIIVQLYLAWRIEDAYGFFRSLGTVVKAEEQLRTLLRGVQGELSSYTFDEYVNEDPSRIRLPEIEARAAERLRASLGTIQPGYGIAVEQVGIRRLVLPEATTEDVFARMRSERETRASRIREEGRSEAAAIRSRAESAAERILAFAESRAQAIRDEGNREAESYFTSFQDDVEFAIFLRQIEALRRVLEHNTTFILDASQLWVLEPFRNPPDQP